MHTSYMALEVRRSGHLPYGHYQGGADTEKRVDKHRAVQEEDMQSR